MLAMCAAMAQIDHGLMVIMHPSGALALSMGAPVRSTRVPAPATGVLRQEWRPRLHEKSSCVPGSGGWGGRLLGLRRMRLCLVVVLIEKRLLESSLLRLPCWGDAIACALKPLSLGRRVHNPPSGSLRPPIFVASLQMRLF